MLTKDEIIKQNENFELNLNTFKKYFKFSGMTLDDWFVSLYLEIPEEVDFKEILDLATKIDNLQTIAHNNYILSSGIASFTKRSVEKIQSKEHLRLISDKTERRTQATLEKEIDMITESEVDKALVAEFVCEFWKEQIKVLEKKSKALESSFWALKNQTDKMEK